MDEKKIASELRDLRVTNDRRFTFKKYGKILPTNTYLLTFDTPNSILAGYFHINVKLYIPSRLRCFKCQKLDMVPETVGVGMSVTMC